MRDLFDEFMEELRRRQTGEPAAEQSAASTRPTDKPTDDDETADGDDRAAATEGNDPTDGPDAGEPTSDEASDEQVRDEQADHEPAAERPRPRAVGGAGGRGGGGSRPRTRVGGPNDGADWRDQLGGVGRRLGLIAVLVVVILLLGFLGSGVDLLTDNIWYRSIGLDDVFWTRLAAQFGLFLGVLVLGLLFLVGNLWLAGRLVPPPDPTRQSRVRGWIQRMLESGADEPGGGGGLFGGGPVGGPGGRPPYGRPRGPGGTGARAVEIELPDLTPAAVWVAVGFGLLVALGLATTVSGRWETVLLWSNQVPFSPDPATPVTDPIFGRDIGFFMFELPFLRLAQALANALLLTGLVVALGRYLAAAARGGFAFVTPVRVHLAVLAGLYLLSIAAGYQLDKYELVYGDNGFATGVSYTDQNARFLAFDVLTVIAGLAAALLIGGAFTQLLWPLGLAIGAWVLASIVLSGIYPEVVQRFSVTPNEFAQERRYIANNIEMTRLAFNLLPWETRGYRGDAPLSSDGIAEEVATFRNARLWDYRPLGLTLDQIQTVRQYYDFYDVDTDRYLVNGETRQVMLSARELAQDRTGATSWVNERLTYTHGVGLTTVPVNEVTAEGLPRLWVRDLPPVSVPGLPTVNQPRIYFGERPSSYVIVNARQPEFDYPRSDSEEAITTSWAGRTGIRLDSTFTRLLFAMRFRDLNLMISDQVTADSQLLMFRSLSARLTRVAPFLRYDRDPYLVVGDDGRLVYIQDAFTTSDRFPHAQPFFPSQLGETTGLSGAPFNYIRNSVKVVMDAYDGTMNFYVADPNDPILRAYTGVFPGLFRPMADVPADLVPHLRVPEELFNVQTRVFATYHVTQPETFYQRTDLWTVPTESGSEQSLPTEAYYVVMRMPGEPEPEFLLLQPMVPQRRPNMIAWVAARNDPEHYGQVRVYQFPQDTSVLGPSQIEAQISADPAISQQITLWNQSGSQVIRGNLLVLPIQDSIIYLQPVYLQSTTSALPQFQRIIVASTSRITWANSLTEALNLLLAGGPGPTPTPGPGPTPSPGASPAPTPGPTIGPGIPPPPAGDVAALVAYANEHFELAQAALRAGDFARYGLEIEAVNAALRLLAELVPASAAP
ncbi:MAG: UPF0182 family protein [Chloroflexi bacterium]|nr:UPF0182 family protein [Chloroflexota bacterium]